MRLKDKVAIVTGAARGLGQVFAVRLAREGAKVAVADIEDTSETVAKIKEIGGEVLAINVDVTDSQDTEKMAAVTNEHYSRIDILVNNAAIYGGLKFTPVEDICEKEWDKVFAVNVKGTWLCCKAVAPYMKKQGSGSIINISSSSIIQGLPKLGHYVASKGAIWAYTRSLARELGEEGIRVNSVTPGYTMTKASKTISDDEQELQAIYDLNVEQRALKSAIQPTDMEGAVIFLASDDSALITGQNINVDGGAQHY